MKGLCLGNMEQTNGATVFLQAHYAGRTPDPLLTVAEWADKYRFLSSTVSAEPGQWRTSRVPYLREIMECLSPSSPVESVVLKKGAQLAGTECGNNWLGYIIDQAPGPMLIVLPTLSMAQRWSKQRLAHLIQDSPSLTGKVAEARSRDSGNTIMLKEFPGGMLIITGANSAVGLRSMPARYLFFDEVDAFPGDVEGEGDPVKLAEKRSVTFRRKKSFKVSTPGIEGMSRISRDFDNGDKRYYFVPCVECGHFQVFQWSRFKWEPGKAETIHMECVGCASHITEASKTQMLAAGRWIATVERPELIESGIPAADIERVTAELASPSKVATFHLSSLYSPVGWYSWREAAQEWMDAQKDPDRLKVFINTVLGETWKERGEAPDWEILYARRENYEIGLVPEGGLFLTAGADVQADRIEVQIIAWGLNKSSWLVDYVVLPGRTAEPRVWDALTALLNTTFRHESGMEMSIIRMAVDSGFATQEVYAWVRSQGPGRVLAVKGQDNGASPVGQPNAVDINVQGKRIRRGVKVWPVATGLLKAELYGWLHTRPAEGETFPPYPFGYCHFPQLGEEFFRQLTAESFRVKKNARRAEWVKDRERNEALDTRIYARAAAAQYGLDRFRAADWNHLRRVAASTPFRERETAPIVPRIEAVSALLPPPPPSTQQRSGRRVRFRMP